MPMPTSTRGLLPLSYSSISTYLSCPESHKWKYIDHLVNIVRDVNDISFGTACHKGFAAYDTFLKKVGIKRSFRFIKSNMASWFTSVPGIDGSRYDEFRSLMLKFALYHSVDPKEIDSSEKLLAVTETGQPCLADSDKAFLVGHLDRLDIVPNQKMARIVDYKTTRSGEADPLQLLIYGVLVAFHFPEIRSFELVFEFPRLGGIQSPYSRHYVPMTLSRDAVLHTWDIVKSTYEKMVRDTERAPRVSTRCSYCPYKPICSAKPYIPMSVNSEASAQELGRSILIMENRMKILREAMKQYVDQKGPVQVSDRIFNMEGIQHFSGNIQPIMKLCKKHKWKIQDFFSVNTSNLKHLMRSDKDAAEILSAHIIITAESRLEHRKAKENAIMDLAPIAVDEAPTEEQA